MEKGEYKTTTWAAPKDEETSRSGSIEATGGDKGQLDPREALKDHGKEQKKEL